MSEETKKSLISELEQLNAKHSSSNLQCVSEIKAFLHSIARVLMKAKEVLDEKDFDLLLSEVELPHDSAKSIIDDFLEHRHYEIFIAPLSQRWLTVFEQISRIGGLYNETEQPHYAKMLVDLRNEAYALAEEIDKLSDFKRQKDIVKDLPPLSTYKEMTDQHFEHIRRLAEDKEYARQLKESLLEEDRLVGLVDDPEGE